MPIPRFLLRELDLLSNVGVEVVVVEEDGPASVSGCHIFAGFTPPALCRWILRFGNYKRLFNV